MWRLHMPHLSQPYEGRHRADRVAPLTEAEIQGIHARIAAAIDERTAVLLDQATDRPYLAEEPTIMPCGYTAERCDGRCEGR